MYGLARNLLFKLDAEKAHNATIKLLKSGISPRLCPIKDPALKTTLWNKHFPNPIGLAAGFDKNAEVIGPMLGMGFGFVEVGTVTPKPQMGNPKPRVFRDINSQTVINRMGFPNAGANQFKENLLKYLDGRPRQNGLVGLNIGMNKEQTDPEADYCHLIKMLAPFADYLTINISSPNTPGLRNLQEPENLEKLIQAVMAQRARTIKTDPPPILIKLSPDLEEDQHENIAKVILNSGVDGLILTNTTLARPDSLPKSYSKEMGGLSGKLLKNRSTEIIRSFYQHTNGKVPIIGLGGVSTGKDAYEKIKAGASLVQLYTALVYQGPNVVQKINEQILHFLQKDGYNHISEAVGAGFGDAAKPSDIKNKSTANS